MTTIQVVRYYSNFIHKDDEIRPSSQKQFKRAMNFQIRRMRWQTKHPSLGIIGWRILRNDTVLAQYGKCNE